MVKNRSLPVWLLVTTMLFGLLFPARSALALETLQITDLYAEGDKQSGTTVHDGDVIDRGLRQLRFNTSGDVNPNMAPGMVTVVDSTGADAQWNTELHWSGAHFAIAPRQLLRANETYTITLKGGKDGLRSREGQTLPADLKFSLRTNDPTLTQTDFFAFGDGPRAGTVKNGGVLPHNPTEIRINFDRRIDSRTVGAVTVRDSHGVDPGWKIQAGSGDVAYMYISKPPSKGETYTFTIKGGRDGLKSEQGIEMAADQTITLHTDDQPYKRTISFETNYDLYKVQESEGYVIDVAQGPLTIGMVTWLNKFFPIGVTLTEADTSAVVFRQDMYTPEFATVTANIPKSGRYWLKFSTNSVSRITLEGLDLVLNTESPAIWLPNMKRFELRNDPFVILLALKNPGGAESLQVTLDQTVVASNAIRPDGTLPQITIDPTNLADGIHVLRFTATRKGPGNIGIMSRPFLVSRFPSFPDVGDGHWAHRYVEVLHHLKILEGRPGGTFAPEQPLSRAEFAKMLALSLRLKLTGAPAAPFVDLRDDWSKPYITALAGDGLILGETIDGKSYFYPDRQITRAEATTIIGRSVGITSKNVPQNKSPFIDAAQIPLWAQPSVMTLAAAKWISGFSDGRFDPAGSLHRDQAAKILGNFYGL